MGRGLGRLQKQILLGLLGESGFTAAPGRDQPWLSLSQLDLLGDERLPVDQVRTLRARYRRAFWSLAERGLVELAWEFVDTDPDGYRGWEGDYREVLHARITSAGLICAETLDPSAASLNGGRRGRFSGRGGA